MQSCFNGHGRERPGCAGCHYAFHVVESGTVTAGRLVPPRVKGPDTCALCHQARHPSAVLGCPRCEDSYGDMVRMAMEAALPVRAEIMQLSFLRWFIGWQARLAGWLGLLAGGAAGDWFQRPDGSQDWFKALVIFVSIPLAQWAIRRRISKRERLLPRLGSHGEIVYGPEARSE